jgi:DNA-binding HxlR family transcriptional regulator
MEEIEKLAKRMEELQKRLEAMEKIIPLASELVNLSERLNIPLNLYSDQLKQLVALNAIKDIVPEIEKDEISRLIIQALIEKPDLNISQIASKVKSLRGKASRRIIAERLKNLERWGIVELILGQNNEKKYRLRSKQKDS